MLDLNSISYIRYQGFQHSKEKTGPDKGMKEGKRI